ncbi:MAG: Smr/MutS family protein [Gammaproteobacteria bacterium]
MAGDDDSDLFRRTIGPVRPVADGRAELRRRRPAPIPRHRRADVQDAALAGLHAPMQPLPAAEGDSLRFIRAGVQPGLFRKLRRGAIPCRAELDLHGMTVAEAHRAVDAFLKESMSLHYRGVRIVHGRGQRSPDRVPVLKSNLAQWLAGSDTVLAYCSARAADGGTGAVYVLLKSPTTARNP